VCTTVGEDEAKAAPPLTWRRQAKQGGERGGGPWPVAGFRRRAHGGGGRASGV
jgi:hypothetical protein